MRPTAHPALMALLLCSPALHAQAKPSAAIPAMAPTQSVSDLPSAHPPVAQAPQGPTRVTWNGSQLTIEAHGEAMPELLGRVAHETGMKINGGVPDERVYGKYGPESVQVVLGELFDGLSINMMLVNDSPTKPKELILTTRSGAPTPPSTRQVAQDDQRPQRQAQPIVPVQRPIPSPPSPQRPQATQPASSSAFPPLSPPPAENTAFTNNSNADTSSSNGNTTNTSTTSTTSTDSSTQPQSPNGVRTPEQIFEELRKRQQQSTSQ